VLKLLPLIAIIALGIWLLMKADASVVKAEPTPFSWPAINASAILTLWAFLGLESATVPVRAVDNPERNIPLATFWGTLGTAVIYILTCSIVVLLVPG
jgi:APA family basic amino acid/polyamine antiporter